MKTLSEKEEMDLRTRCAQLAMGDVRKARELYEWIAGSASGVAEDRSNDGPGTNIVAHTPPKGYTLLPLGSVAVHGQNQMVYFVDGVWVDHKMAESKKKNLNSLWAASWGTPPTPVNKWRPIVGKFYLIRESGWYLITDKKRNVHRWYLENESNVSGQEYLAVMPIASDDLSSIVAGAPYTGPDMTEQTAEAIQHFPAPDAPNPGEGWRLIEPEQASEEDQQYWYGKRWIERTEFEDLSDRPPGARCYRRVKITPEESPFSTTDTAGRKVN